MNLPLAELAKQGLGWLLFAVALGVIAYLYKEKVNETNARIQDAKDHTSMLLKIQQATHDTIAKVYEIWKGRR